MAIFWRIEMLGGLRLQLLEASRAEVPEEVGEEVGESVTSPVVTRFRSRQAGALLAFLAYFPGSHGREPLAEMLWPGHDPDLSRAHLRVVLASLRQVLEVPGEHSIPVLLADRHSVGLNSQVVVTDVAEFETALQEAAKALGRAAQSAHLERAVDLYRGALLNRGALLIGDCDEWLVPEAQRLEEDFFAALRRLISGFEDQGDLERALHYARRGASLDVLREDVARDLMRLYAAMGQPALAVRHYRELERSLGQTLNAKPAPQTRELLRRIQSQAGEVNCPASSRPNLDFASSSVPPEAGPPTLSENQPDSVFPPVSPLAKTVHLPPQPLPPQALPPQPLPPQPLPPQPLPPQWTRFFGRQAEIAAVQELLRRGTRLITLIGTGGIGKTRLALEVARFLREEPQTSRKVLWFVPLTGVMDARMVAGEIAGAMRLPVGGLPVGDLPVGDLPVGGSSDPLELLVQALGALPHPVLVLDNFEQLLPAAASSIQELLAHVPQLQILLTSRQELGLLQEHAFQVPPLPVPAPSPDFTPEALLDFAGVRLFHDRARAASPGFGITKHNAPALARLCARLEGLPLAIELCAARAGSLSPSKMLERLERRLDFLAELSPNAGPDTMPSAMPNTGPDAAPASIFATHRHSTLRATLEWSYALLWPDLARFFTRLSAFRGGCTVRAAAQVAQEPHAAHFLEQLRAASLIVREAGSNPDQARFRLLETVREFAAEHLSDAQSQQCQRLHAQFYCELAQIEHEHSMAADAQRRAASAARMRPEHDNFRAALNWSLQHDAVLALHLVHGTSPLWNDVVSHSEHLAEQALERALERAPDAPSGLVSAVLGIAAAHAQHRGDYEGQRALSQRRLALLDASQGEIPNEFQHDLDGAWALFNLGCSAEGLCQYQQAIEYFEQALQKFLVWNHLGPEALQNVAWTLGRLGECASQSGDLDAAGAHFRQGLDVFRSCHDLDGVAGALSQLGDVARKRGDLPEARRFFADSERLEQEVGDGRAHPWRRLEWAHLKWAEGDLLSARQSFASALRAFSENQVMDGTLRCLLFLGCLNLEEGDESGVLLLGCEAAQRELHAIPAPPECRAARERAQQQARFVLSADQFEAATQRGRALTLKKAIQIALRPKI